MDQVTKPTALVVEDDEMQRDLVSTLLEESDMHVIGCETAEEAVNVLEIAGPSIAMLFTDVNLAGRMTGVDLSRIATRLFPNLTVIVTTGAAQPKLPDGALFMPKPWRALDVLREVEKIHGHAAASIP